MRFAYLLLAIAVVGCSSDKKEKFSANLGCTAAAALERAKPNDGVKFVVDTAQSGAVNRAWRAAVGQPVIDRSERACEDAPIDSLLVVSWNVHVGGADIRRLVSDIRTGKFTNGVGQRHFVMLLQEAYRKGSDVPAHSDKAVCPARQNGVGPDITQIADSLGLALFYAPSMRNGCEVRQDRGNAILSTLPLSNLRALELPVVRQRRVAIFADVKGHTSNNTNWTLSLGSVHLENRGPGNGNAWVQGRARQAKALVQALPQSTLAVVSGDFNTLQGANEPAVKIVGARFAHSPAHPKGMTYVSYGIVRSHLDYMFFQSAGPTRYWRAPSRYESDHFPMMGFVKLRSPS